MYSALDTDRARLAGWATFSRGVCLGIGLALTAMSASPEESRSPLMEEFVITATKKNVVQTAHDVPLAVTAYGADQLDALHVRDLTDLSFSMPNVQLDDIATAKGVANFSIRGLGINSSIPSIDPTVGVFVDGMYMGITSGVLLDMFDLESIEVLRGPQGLLFGRNVTGGAVVINTKDPGDEFAFSAKTVVEGRLGEGTGPNYYAMASVTGPVVENLAAKLSMYMNIDEGWHENLFDGRDFGKTENYIARRSVKWSPTADIELLVKYEHGKLDADGPAAQNAALFDKDEFDFSVDERGFSDHDWDQVIVEANWDVSFGDGTLTNIFGWRDYQGTALVDIDATPTFLFHSTAMIDQEQYSNEFRYAGRFVDAFSVTGGIYYFTQDLSYQETRSLPATLASLGFATVFEGGGIQDHDTWGVFLSVDYDFLDHFTLTFGGRYTEEDKSVKIASLNANIAALPAGNLLSGTAVRAFLACDVIGEACAFDFVDEDSWDSFTPKIGLQWRPSDEIQAYAHWTKGFRSGGYNLRNTDPTIGPGPFDQEEQNSYEVGIKYRAPGRRVNSSLALYWNDIEDMLREIITPGVAGAVQVIRNTAEVTIRGFEVETLFWASQNLVINFFVGYTDGEYDKVVFDLNGDGLVNGLDEDLDIPRLSPWTYGAGFVYTRQVPRLGIASARLNFNHRDKAASTDNNIGQLREVDHLDFSLSLTLPSRRWTARLYGKNMLDDVAIGGDTITPFGVPFGTFSPLGTGRIVGTELKFDY